MYGRVLWVENAIRLFEKWLTLDDSRLKIKISQVFNSKIQNFCQKEKIKIKLAACMLVWTLSIKRTR